MITHKLTDRQRKFAEAYILLGNKAKAAEQAGLNKSYAYGAARQPAVQEYLAELQNQIPANLHAEVINFLTDIMRGKIEANDLRTEAAYQLGIRAGLWSNKRQYRKRIGLEIADGEMDS